MLSIIIFKKNNKKIKIIKENEEIIKEELNIKNLEYLSVNPYIKYKVKLNPNVVGPIIKEKFNDVLREIEKMETKNLIESIRKGKVNLLGFELPAEAFTIEEENDPSTVIVHGNGVDVVLKKEINTELFFEGLAREIVRRIQIMRKEMNLEYNDRIMVKIEGDNEIIETMKKHRTYIENETLSRIVENVDGAYEKIWNINKKRILMWIKKFNRK
ncbi:MAG: DUF5915 domain-containing protein [Thermoplasmata archaeon]